MAPRTSLTNPYRKAAPLLGSSRSVAPFRDDGGQRAAPTRVRSCTPFARKCQRFRQDRISPACTVWAIDLCQQALKAGPHL